STANDSPVLNRNAVRPSNALARTTGRLRLRESGSERSVTEADPEDRVRIVVAMSGGVDSSVAAALLHEQGHDVVGVHMKLHDATGASPGHCCGLDDSLDARKVAADRGFPFYVMDLREAFQKAVMDDFANEYRAGRTPNPCV